MMFDVVEGGIVEPIEFDKNKLVPEKSIIVMDEENQTVWLWHGQKRGLVARRTALRQAESLKGHGYQAGNAIIGRDLHKIVEIDSRKVGREPETTELFKKFEPILEASYEPIGNLIYVKKDKGSHKTSSSSSSSKPLAVSEKPVETKSLTNSSSNNSTPQKPTPPHGVKRIEERPVLKPVEKNPTVSKKAQLSDILIQGAVIMAVTTQYKDLWISVKPDNSLALEHMDGKICTFKVQNGEISYLNDSFAEVPPDKKSAIEKKIEDYLK